jgi:hypothetical protein
MIQDSRRKSPEEKALYHQVLGAGKGRVMRPFLGLSPADEDEIERLIGVRVEAAIVRGIGV